jgi:hypothetical protein
MRPAGPAPTTKTSLMKLPNSLPLVYETCDATSELLTDERDSVSFTSPGAIFCSFEWGSLLDVERFMRFHKDEAML